jgi:hypothetical protein
VKQWVGTSPGPVYTNDYTNPVWQGLFRTGRLHRGSGLIPYARQYVAVAI